MEDTVCDSVSSDDLSQFAPVQFSSYVDPNGVTDNQGRNIGTIPSSFYPSMASEPYSRIPPDHSNQTDDRQQGQMYEQSAGMYHPQQQRPPTDGRVGQGERGYASGHPPSAHPEPKRN